LLPISKKDNFVFEIKFFKRITEKQLAVFIIFNNDYWSIFIYSFL